MTPSEPALTARPQPGSADELALLESLQIVRLDASGEVDVEQFEHRMSLSPVERLRANDKLAAFAAVLRSGGATSR